jgi:biotin transport system substrate-specific component
MSSSAAAVKSLHPTSLGWQALAMAGGVCVLTASSYIEVPMQPVPITLQTLAVTLVGAVLGWRLGVLTILAWLAAAAAGLPVLAGVTHLAAFAGPTAGYLLAFPAAGALCGWLAERGWNGRAQGLALVSMVLGNVLCLAGGAAWLALSLGVTKAVVVGVAPFLVGGLLKAAMGAVVLKGIAVARAA